MTISFNLPTRGNARVTKVEKYDFPVVTTSVYGGPKTSRSFTFNKAAIAALGLKELKKDKEVKSKVAFGFSNDGKIVYIGNASNTDNPNAIEVGKGTDRLSSKPIYDYVLNLHDMSQDVENEFKLVSTGEVAESVTLFELVPLNLADKDTAKSEDTVLEAKAEELIGDAEEEVAIDQEVTEEVDTEIDAAVDDIASDFDNDDLLDDLVSEDEDEEDEFSII